MQGFIPAMPVLLLARVAFSDADDSFAEPIHVPLDPLIRTAPPGLKHLEELVFIEFRMNYYATLLRSPLTVSSPEWRHIPIEDGKCIVV